MSDFSVPVTKVVTAEHHPNADRLDVITIFDYQAISGRDRFAPGDKVVYIPEQAIVPQHILEEMELVGKLGGGNKDRVKPIKLRGVISQGLAYTPKVWPEHWVDGYDVAEELGITKYEPSIPVSFGGAKGERDWAEICTSTILRSYDIENIKKHSHILIEGEQVVFTEKLHGTCCIVGYDIYLGQFFVTSKGVARGSYVIKENDENVYWLMAKQNKLDTLLKDFAESHNCSVCLYGEIIGVQDLKYGLKNGHYDYYAFDLLVPSGFASHDDFNTFCSSLGIKRVPVLYEGPYSREKVKEYTSGPSVIGPHIREGIVIYTNPLRRDMHIGTVRLKSVSEEYLFRSGEQTEYQ